MRARLFVVGAAFAAEEEQKFSERICCSYRRSGQLVVKALEKFFVISCLQWRNRKENLFAEGNTRAPLNLAEARNGSAQSVHVKIYKDRNDLIMRCAASVARYQRVHLTRSFSEFGR